MTKYLVTPLFLIFLFVTTSFAQKYKGGDRHNSPKIDELPVSVEYDFSKDVNDTLADKLNKKIDELFSKYHVAGITVTALVPGQGVWQTNRGLLAKNERTEIDSSTVFYWASVSKLVTSTIIHQLVVEEKLSFKDRLSNWFPDIQNAQKITIEQLLTHTNGIYSFNSDSGFQENNEKYSPKELLGISQKQKNLFEPGEYWSYTNTGYLLLALIIEKIESETFSDVVKDRISTPLKLSSLRTFEEGVENFALAHNKDSVIYKDYSIPLGAGDIISSSYDMAKFLSLLLSGKIIPLESVYAMMKNLYPMFDNGQYYGRGLMLYSFKEINNTDNTWIGHSGGTPSYRSVLFYDLKSKVIMAISINENFPAEAVAGSLMKLVNE